MASVTVVERGAVVRMGYSRNLLVAEWFGMMDIAHVRAMHREMKGIAGRYPRQLGMFNVIAAGKPNFPEDVRGALTQLLADKDLHGCGAAHVILLDGMAGVAVRAFISTVVLLGRPPTPQRIFAGPSAAAAWFAPQLSAGGQAWTAEDILQAQAALSA